MENSPSPNDKLRTLFRESKLLGPLAFIKFGNKTLDDILFPEIKWSSSDTAICVTGLTLAALSLPFFLGKYPRANRRKAESEVVLDKQAIEQLLLQKWVREADQGPAEPQAKETSVRQDPGPHESRTFGTGTQAQPDAATIADVNTGKGCENGLDQFSEPPQAPKEIVRDKMITAEEKNAPANIFPSGEGEEASRPLLPSPPEADSGRKAKDEKVPEDNANQAPTPAKVVNDDVWAGPSSEPPVEFTGTPLMGKQKEIAQALKKAGILTNGSTKELINKLKKKAILWGKRAGRDFFVYVNSKLVEPDRIERARQELDKIKNPNR